MATQTQDHEEDRYQPQNALGEATKSALILGGAGLFVSAVQNSLARSNVGTLGVFARTGAAIGIFGAAGATFSFAQLASANLREKNDTYNTAIGGFFAGAVASLRVRTFPALVGYGAAVSIIMSLADATGGSLSGFRKNPDVDEYERKEALRTNRRRPLSETIQELGESRGIAAPGYAERRTQRIKDAYGIDVNPSPSQAS